MKVRDYISAMLDGWSVEVSDSLIDAGLIDVELNGDSEYDSEVKVKIDKLIYNIIPQLLSGAKSISEGGFSITYDKEGMVAYYGFLCKQLGLPNNLEKNKIRDRSNLW